AKCNVSFQIRYTSSIPATSASAVLRYRVKNSSGSYAQYSIASVPASGGTIDVPGFPDSGEYEYILDLTANGVSAQKTGFFLVGECSPPPCETPIIKNVYLRDNYQIVLDYSVDGANLETPEYQIATDPDFAKIIHFKVGFDYQPIEYIDMSGGNIPDNTLLYIRARKHCSPAGISEWSGIKTVRSGRKGSYLFEDAYCVSDIYKSPTDPEPMGGMNICWNDRTPLLKTLRLSTPVPQRGSFIYLPDDVNPAIPAIPGNLASFDEAGEPSIGFNSKGIKWIRFGNYDREVIYDVNPLTGQIIDISSFNCISV
ncbi:hypothetical protein AB4Y90_08485, partial [Chryseobacterium sp. 2TAF14]|uniref:hypothetical protein n=1 Tax=Chryseobacterium sp. 2TAF14 TaxID=3233007 RepID=UPI003F8FFF53